MPLRYNDDNINNKAIMDLKWNTWEFNHTLSGTTNRKFVNVGPRLPPTRPMKLKTTIVDDESDIQNAYDVKKIKKIM